MIPATGELGVSPAYTGVLLLFLSMHLQFELYGSIESGLQTSNSVLALPAGIPLPGCFSSSDSQTAVVALFGW